MLVLLKPSLMPTCLGHAALVALHFGKWGFGHNIEPAGWERRGTSEKRQHESNVYGAALPIRAPTQRFLSPSFSTISPEALNCSSMANVISSRVCALASPSLPGICGASVLTSIVASALSAHASACNMRGSSRCPSLSPSRVSSQSHECH
jgi:hypothetical protein